MDEPIYNPWWKSPGWWDYQSRVYEERYGRFCREWHLDPEDPGSAVLYEENYHEEQLDDQP